MHVSSTVDCCNSQKDKRNTSRFPYSLPFLFVPALNSATRCWNDGASISQPPPHPALSTCEVCTP